MNTLQCNVTTCASNKDYCCCQSAIKVQGKSANSCGETRCQSFNAKGSGEVSNSTHYCVPNPSLDIYCTASNCSHWQNDKCNKDCVCINGDMADTMSETECSSFEKR